MLNAKRGREGSVVMDIHCIPSGQTTGISLIH